MAITHNYRTEEIANKVCISEDEVYRRAMLLGFAEVAPGRWPLATLAYLKAQKEGLAICWRCKATGTTEDRCECDKAYLQFLPEPEPAA